MMVTWQTLIVEPKSTCSHCGSLHALDQRVLRLPSTARLAVVPAFSIDEAVAVLLSATFVVPQLADGVLVATGVLVGGSGVFVLVAVAGMGVLVGGCTVGVFVLVLADVLTGVRVGRTGV